VDTPLTYIQKHQKMIFQPLNSELELHPVHHEIADKIPDHLFVIALTN